MTPRVTVVGLGPGGPDLVTAGTRDAIARVPVRHLRTRRHPAASVVEGAESFDEVYDGAERIGDVYAAIVEALVAAAAEHGEVLYAVPGSPRVAERSVDLLAADPRVEVDVLPALSFLDLAWSASASTRSLPAPASSTGGTSRPPPPASGARSWWPSATAEPCCPT